MKPELIRNIYSIAGGKHLPRKADRGERKGERPGEEAMQAGVAEGDGVVELLAGVMYHVASPQKANPVGKPVHHILAKVGEQERRDPPDRSSRPLRPSGEALDGPVISDIA